MTLAVATRLLWFLLILEVARSQGSPPNVNQCISLPSPLTSLAPCISIAYPSTCVVRINTTVVNFQGQRVPLPTMTADLRNASTTCVTLGSSFGLSCQLCVDLTQSVASGSSSGNLCASARVMCNGAVQSPSASLGCFAPIPQLAQCIQCPLACSGHGTCSGSTCTCDNGYSGLSCAISQPDVRYCTQLSGVGEVCGDAWLQPCAVVIGVELNGAQLTTSSPLDVRTINANGGAVQCSAVVGCQLCVNLSTIATSPTSGSASVGCLAAGVLCPGLPSVYQSIGCFEDTAGLLSTQQCSQVTQTPSLSPAPTLSCAPTCYAHGNCVDGACQCFAGWSGALCSIASSACVQNCGSHGECDSLTGTCRCQTGYTGANCSVSSCTPPCGTHGVCVKSASTSLTSCVCQRCYSGAACLDYTHGCDPLGNGTLTPEPTLSTTDGGLATYVKVAIVVVVALVVALAFGIFVLYRRRQLAAADKGTDAEVRGAAGGYAPLALNEE